MLKKIFFFTCIFVISHNSSAETCPSVMEIKNNYFRGWQVLNINSGNPVPVAMLEEFKNTVKSFALAEWMEGAPEGEAHCYYQGKESDYMEVYLAKENLINIPGNHNWKPIGQDAMQCRTGINDCLFQPAP